MVMLLFHDPRSFIDDNFTWMLVASWLQLPLSFVLLFAFPTREKARNNPSPNTLYAQKQWPISVAFWCVSRVLMISLWTISIVYLANFGWAWMLTDLDELLGDHVLWSSRDIKKYGTTFFLPLCWTCFVPWLAWKLKRDRGH